MVLLSTYQFIQVCTPTSASDDKHLEVFYGNLKEAIDSSRTSSEKFCLGDFNSSVEKRRLEKFVGEHGVDIRNERGERLIEFAKGNCLLY